MLIIVRQEWLVHLRRSESRQKRVAEKGVGGKKRAHFPAIHRKSRPVKRLGFRVLALDRVIHLEKFVLSPFNPPSQDKSCNHVLQHIEQKERCKQEERN